tara:strand:- start:2697 stop:2945 length:249 start_codon:yes stop_codon:yes gene_type:complete
MNSPPMKLAHRRLVDLTGRKVEAGQILISRDAGSLHVIGNGPDLPLGHFGLQQLGEHWHRGVECWSALATVTWTNGVPWLAS